MSDSNQTANANSSQADALQRGMAGQLARWRDEVKAPGRRLGWKIGFNDRPSQERLSLSHPVIGFLRRDCLLTSGATFMAPAGATIKAEMEIAMRIGRNLDAGVSTDEAEAAIVAIAPAFEVVNVTQPLDGIEALLQGNLYHAAVLIGNEITSVPKDPRAMIRGRLTVDNGVVRESEPFRLPVRFGDLVRVTADLLGQNGEQLSEGDWIISGSMVDPLVVAPGSRITGEISLFEPITLAFATR